MKTLHTSRRARWLVLTLGTALGVALTLALGCWQLRRAADKQALWAAITRQSEQSAWDNAQLAQQWAQHGPSMRATAPAPPSAPWLHHPVQLRGQWLDKYTLYLDNRQMQGRPGFFVVTPLRLAPPHEALVIAVQRGWIARNFLERSALQPVQTPAGPVLVQGRLQGALARLYEFRTAHDSEAGEALGAQAASRIRQNIDLAQWAAATHLPLLPVTVLQTGAASEGLQRQWPQPSAGVERHYGYAAQWFALAALITLLYVWFQIVPRCKRAQA